MAVSRAVIQVSLDHLRRELLDLFSFTRAYLTVKLLCGLDYAFPFGFDASQNFPGQGIMQPERDEISGALFFPVWKAAAVSNLYLAEARAGRPRDSRRDAGATV